MKQKGRKKKVKEGMRENKKGISEWKEGKEGKGKRPVLGKQVGEGQGWKEEEKYEDEGLKTHHR